MKGWTYNLNDCCWYSPEGLRHAHKPALSQGPGLRTKDITYWSADKGAPEVESSVMTAPELRSYRALQNVVTSAKAQIGGETSRILFQPMFDTGERPGVPNALWLITSLSFLASGILMVLL